MPRTDPLREERIQQYNAAGTALEAAVEAVRTASDADLPAADQAFADAQAEFQRCKANLEREESLDSIQPFTPRSGRRDPLADGRVRAYSHGESIAEDLLTRQAVDPDDRNLSLGRALRAMVTGDWRSAAAERRALGTGTDPAGGYLVPELLSARFFDKARALLVTSKAGVQTIMLDDNALGTYTFAKLVADPTVSWTAEAGTITPADPTFGAVSVVSKKATCLLKVSRELMSDAPNANLILERTLTSAFAAEIDRVILEGTGTGNEPGGIVATTGVNADNMGTNGAAPTNDTGPAKLAATALLVRQDNHEPSAIISSPRQWNLFHTLKDTTKQPIRFGAGIDDLPWYQTSNCSDARTQGTSNAAGNVYIGDWTRAFLAVRQNFELYVTRDPYLTTDEVAILCTARVDVQVEDPGAFAVLEGVTAT